MYLKIKQLTENTVRLHYKFEQFKTVYRNNSCHNHMKNIKILCVKDTDSNVEKGGSHSYQCALQARGQTEIAR